jgi:hypothetical protein
MSDADRRDLEFDLMRVLSTDGLTLGSCSNEDRRERIRFAILQRGLTDQLWPLDRGITYGRAFENCYGRKVEMRRMQRDAHGRPGLQTQRKDPGDDDDAGDEDDDEGVAV